MNELELFQSLTQAKKISQIEDALEAFKKAQGDSVKPEPVDGNDNNRGSIDTVADAGRSLIERVTNAFDALLKLEHDKHKGKPDCRSPHQAAIAWFGVPRDGGISKMSKKDKKHLAKNIIVRVEEGERERSHKLRLVSIIDHGIGIEPHEFSNTILKLQGNNKVDKFYLMGAYGQGGSSTFKFSKYTVIISLKYRSNQVGFTVVYYQKWTPERKHGYYAFLGKNGAPLCVDADRATDILLESKIVKNFEHGTIVRHFGYDLTKYKWPLGPASVYGLLDRMLFDPVTTLRFENRLRADSKDTTIKEVHNGDRLHPDKGTTIKGVRNALNADQASRRLSIAYRNSWNIPLGGDDHISLECWVIDPEEIKKRQGVPPTRAYIDPKKPVIFTINGQNHGEFSWNFIDKAGLVFLDRFLICHLNCNALTQEAKEDLFTSNREQIRTDYDLYKDIRLKVIETLKGDKELEAWNEKARQQSLEGIDKDERYDEMCKELSRMWKQEGNSPQMVGGTIDAHNGGRAIHPGHPHGKPEDVEDLCDPPNYVEILEKTEPLDFYLGRIRHLRIKTDAIDQEDGAESPFRIILEGERHLKELNQSTLTGGNMRIDVECHSTEVGETGFIRIEHKTYPRVRDQLEYVIVEVPETKAPQGKTNFPDVKIIPVPDSNDKNWHHISDDQDITRNASNFAKNKDGKVYVYYSQVYPTFKREWERLRKKSPAEGVAFLAKYKRLIAAYSLSMQRDRENESDDLPESNGHEDLHRQERCRQADVAAWAASSQQISNYKPLGDDDSE